jgi:four helix bundle protein
VIKDFEDLKVFKLSFSSAMDIFHLSKKFPKSETYSLTDQILRSSRSVSANIVEGWAKREYINVFKKHLIDSLGEAKEVKLWLKFAYNCEYINDQEYNSNLEKYEEICRMITGLHNKWKDNFNDNL